MNKTDFFLETERAAQAGGAIPCTHITHAVEADSQNNPCLLIVPSVFGFDSTFMLHCRRFVAAGLQVYALDSFWRSCPGPLEADESGVPQAMARMAALEDADCDSDVSALANYIRAQHPSVRVIGLGICFGGRPIARAACDKEIDSVVAWHGVRIGELGDRLSTLTCAGALHYGAIDAWTPKEECDVLRDRFKDRPQLEISVHDDCDHGFTHLNRASVFNQNAYETAYRSVVRLAGA
ncbi:MAG: dienelactone hydrolase family protein [Pseudomonadota bacterium]